MLFRTDSGRLATEAATEATDSLAPRSALALRPKEAPARPPWRAATRSSEPGLSRSISRYSRARGRPPDSAARTPQRGLVDREPVAAAGGRCNAAVAASSRLVLTELECAELEVFVDAHLQRMLASDGAVFLLQQLRRHVPEVALAVPGVGAVEGLQSQRVRSQRAAGN